MNTELVPKLVEIGHVYEVTKLWYQQLEADRTIPHNKQEIIIRVYEEGTCLLTGTAISGVINVIKKDAKMISKYKDLTTEMQSIWNVKQLKLRQ